MKAVFLDFGTMGSGLDLKELESLVDELVVFDQSPDDKVAERIADVDIVFTNKIRLTRELLEASPDLKFIALTATGTDNIDTECARQHGIVVANIRHYCTQSVVEHVFGVLLSLTHSLGPYRNAVRAGDWQRSADFCMLHYPVRELSSMTLGVVGYGALGQGVARIAREFGMKVLVSARPNAETVPDGRVGFAELLAESDVVSLHCPPNEDGTPLIDAAAINGMKPGVYIVNTARADLIDEDAVIAALDDGRVAGLAQDVFREEPPSDRSLVSHEKVVASAHIGAYTNESVSRAVDVAVERLIEKLS